MKLKWPLWAIATVWLLLHGLAWLSIMLGLPASLGLIASVVIYTVFGAFAQSIGYGILVGKKTLESWKSGIVDPKRKNKAFNYACWLLLPLIYIIPFVIIAINEK